MQRIRRLSSLLLLSAAVAVYSGAQAQTAAAKPATAAKAKAAKPADALDPKAMDILRAMSKTLAGAQSMFFNALTTYETLSSLGPPLSYFTRSEVLMQRPDKLRVVTLGDGPPAEYYYDGKTLTAYAPAEKMVAVAPAPPTIDAMLEAAFKSAAIYFPFADVLGSDPYQIISDGLVKAFYIGQSKAVDNTTTDVLGLVSNELFMQLWVGTDDHLPRMMRVVYKGDPALLRHEVSLSNWKLDPVVAADAFASLNAQNATRISFGDPAAAAGAARKTQRPAAKAAAPAQSVKP